MKFVLLNAVVVRPGLLVLAEEAILEEARAVATAGASSFIGHPATAALLGVSPNRGEYVPEAGDVAYVVRLRRRSQTSGDVDARPEDLEVLRIRYFGKELLFDTLFEHNLEKYKEVSLYSRMEWVTSLLESLAPRIKTMGTKEARKSLDALLVLMRSWRVSPEDIDCSPVGPVWRELDAVSSFQNLIPEAFQALKDGREAEGEVVDCVGDTFRWKVQIVSRTPGIFYWRRDVWDGDEWRGPNTTRSALIREFGTKLPAGYKGPEPIPAERREYGLFIEAGARWITRYGESDVPDAYVWRTVEVEVQAQGG